jgi:hypothetical protein
MLVRGGILPLVACVFALGTTSSAQNWSFDARKVGLGSPGGETLATRMIDDEREYRSIVLPFGLIQVFRDFSKLNPSKDEFDLVRTVEYAAGPLHYTVGRDRTTSADDFIVDISNRELSRDLNDYKGFIPLNQPAAAGLASPNWGKTFRVHQGDSGSFQGIYLGAGPYISMRAAPTIDDRLIRILGADERVYLPNAQLTARTSTQGQLALAVAGGYRGRFAWPTGVGGGTDREGLYLALNYNYLRGFRYEDIDFQLRMDTDGGGLVAVNPLLPPPLFVSRTSAESGTGMAIDFGIGAVVNGWELGFGARGLGNRLDWSGAERTNYFHADLLQGSGDLIEGVPVPVGTVRIELPIDYRANVGYDVDRWAAVAEFGRGLQGATFHGGGELRFGPLDVRGGAVYSRELWNPAGGVGFNMSQRTSLDVAVYSNSANVQRRRNPALAVSLRFNR